MAADSINGDGFAQEAAPVGPGIGCDLGAVCSWAG